MYRDSDGDWVYEESDLPQGLVWHPASEKPPQYTHAYIKMMKKGKVWYAKSYYIKGWAADGPYYWDNVQQWAKVKE